MSQSPLTSDSEIEEQEMEEETGSDPAPASPTPTMRASRGSTNRQSFSISPRQMPPAPSLVRPDSLSTTSEQATSIPELAGASSFKLLTHQVGPVRMQLDSGVYVLKRCKILLGTYAKLQEKFAHDLKKAVQLETGKLQTMSDRDGMITIEASVVELFSELNAVADDHLQHSKIINNDCVYRLEKAHTQVATQIKDAKEFEHKINKTYDQVQVGIHKGRSNCRKLLDEVHRKQDQHEKKVNPASPPELPEAEKEKKNKYSMKKLKNLRNITQKFRDNVGKDKDTLKSFEKAKGKAQQAFDAYIGHIEIANEHYDDYQNQQLPRLLRMYEDTETVRGCALKEALALYSLRGRELAGDAQTHALRFETISSQIDPDSDMEGFIKGCLDFYGETPPPSPFVCDVPNPDTIEMSAKTKSVFSVSLEAVMAFQEENLPDASTELPLILTTLAEAVVALGGLQEKGIFRISVSTDTLAGLRKAINDGDYTMALKDPNVPAALLKAWFRDMAEPVIPFEFYEECCLIGGRISDPKHVISARLAIANEEDHPHKAAVLDIDRRLQTIVETLPPLNLRVIKYMVAFMKKICSPENVEHNKMTTSNLAIVFAPSFLRHQEDDPMRMLQDTKNMTQFMVILVESLVFGQS